MAIVKLFTNCMTAAFNCVAIPRAALTVTPKNKLIKILNIIYKYNIQSKIQYKIQYKMEKLIDQ